MSTINEVRQILYDAFIIGWADRTPYIFENEDYEPPEADWVKLSVVNSASSQESLGIPTNRRFSRRGQLVLQINTLSNVGLSTADGHAEAFKLIFEGTTQDGVRLFACSTREFTNDGRYQVSFATIDFEYEQIR